MSGGHFAVDIVGTRIGRWVVLAKAPKRSKTSNAFWLCRCDCGKEREVIGTTLRRGESTSCGCYRAEVSAQRMLKHGHAQQKTSATYNSWAGAILRCTNPNYYNWEYYGGRGIAVCERWLGSFESFLADMGARPEGKTLDRYPDQNGNYAPGNCRWATPTEQRLNSRPRRWRRRPLQVHGLRVRET